MTGYITLIVILLLIIMGLLVVIYRLWRQTQRVSLGLDEVAEDTLKELYYLSRQQPAVKESDLQTLQQENPNLHVTLAPSPPQ